MWNEWGTGDKVLLSQVIDVWGPNPNYRYTSIDEFPIIAIV